MKTIFFTLIFSLILSFNLFGQHKSDLELGVQLGASLYNGDLSTGGFSHYLDDIRPAGGVYGKVYFTDWIAGRLGLNIGYLNGEDDSDTRNRRRNLDFRSILLDAHLLVEVYPFKFGRKTNQKLSPYLVGGIAGFYFNPKTDLNGVTYELQPLGTEGQGIPGNEGKYTKVQTALAIGGGLRLELKNGLAIFGEIVPRYTFTDYLDDVGSAVVNYNQLVANNGEIAGQLSNRDPKFDPSDVNSIIDTRGGSANDWYIIGTIGVALKFTRLNGSGQGCPGF